MKKFLILTLLFCLLLSGCMSKGQSAESATSVLSGESEAQSVEPTSSAVSIESEAQSAELTAQQAEITDVIKRYFAALENDDTEALAALTNYRYALFGYEKGEDGWVCPIKALGNAIAYNLKIEYCGNREAIEWSPPGEIYYVTYEIDNENRVYQNYLKNDPAFFDMYFNQEIDDIYKLLDNGRYATWEFIVILKVETTGTWVISGYGTGA